MFLPGKTVRYRNHYESLRNGEYRLPLHELERLQAQAQGVIKALALFVEDDTAGPTQHNHQHQQRQPTQNARPPASPSLNAAVALSQSAPSREVPTAGGKKRARTSDAEHLELPQAKRAQTSSNMEPRLKVTATTSGAAMPAPSGPNENSPTSLPSSSTATALLSPDTARTSTPDVIVISSTETASPPVAPELDWQQYIDWGAYDGE
jgi:hypothetical protein